MGATKANQTVPPARSRGPSPVLGSIVPAMLIWAAVTVSLAYGANQDWLWSWLAGGSVATLVLWALDKAASKLHRWRVPEAVLLLLALAGGVIGAWIGMLLLRHKSQHRAFYLVQGIATTIWGLLAIWWLAR